MEANDQVSSRTGKLQRLYDLAASQAGYFTAAQAGRLGYTLRSLVHHVAAGHVERIARGFYRLAGVPADPHEDIVATWLRLSPHQAVVSHDTALALYDLAPSRSQEIHLTLPRERRPRTPQLTSSARIHTTMVALRRNEVATRFGVHVTVPARTIADVADIGGDPSVIIDAARRALSSGLVTASELLSAAIGRSGRVRQLVERAIAEAGARA